MSVFRRFKLPQLLRKQKSDENSIVNIPRFDCNALAVKERLGQGSFGDVYTVDYKAPGKVMETVVVKKVLPALDQAEKIVSIRVMTLINTNVVASRHIKREEVLLPVAVRHAKTPELNLNFIRGNENAQGETAFLRGIFCLEYPSRHSEKVNVYFANYRFSFRKPQIFISQTTDSHFVNCRFSFRKLQIFISFRSISFRSISFRKLH